MVLVGIDRDADGGAPVGILIGVGAVGGQAVRDVDGLAFGGDAGGQGCSGGVVIPCVRGDVGEPGFICLLYTSDAADD